jgi:hypothetical protein
MNQFPENRLLSVFAPFPRFEINGCRTALVMVDMQYVDAHPEFGIGRAANSLRQHTPSTCR